MLQAGFARVDVTPQLGTELTGYFERRFSDGVLDPIELNALAVSLGEEAILVITGDFMYMHEKSATHYRTLISEKLGIPADCILMQSIHQHTTTTPGPSGVTDAIYNEILGRKYVDVARMALDDRREATLLAGETQPAEKISFVRRYLMRDGSFKTNPGFLNPDVVRPVSEADNTVRLVRFKRADAPDIALVGFQTHPDVIGGNKFSADWPGFVRRLTEKALPDTRCILVNGCQGDVNHYNVFKEKLKKDERYDYARHMGSVISDAVVSLWDNSQPVAVDRLGAEVAMVSVPTKTYGLEKRKECIVYYEEMRRGIKEHSIPKPMKESGDVRRVACLDQYPVIQTIPVSMVAFGKIAILGFGGEPFTEYALQVREKFPDLFLFTACLANGAQGYLPSDQAFEEGGYEAASSPFTPEMPSAVLGEAVRMLRDYQK